MWHRRLRSDCVRRRPAPGSGLLPGGRPHRGGAAGVRPLHVAPGCAVHSARPGTDPARHGRGIRAVARVLLLALFRPTSLRRPFDGLVRWRWLSPFYYYDQSSPLVPGGRVDARATFTLFAIAAVVAILAAVAFRFRDIGSPLFSLPVPHRPASYDVSGTPVWRVPVLRDLYDRRAGLLVWTAGVAGLGVVSVALTKNVVDPLLAIPCLARYFPPFLNRIP